MRSEKMKRHEENLMYLFATATWIFQNNPFQQDIDLNEWISAFCQRLEGFAVVPSMIVAQKSFG